MKKCIALLLLAAMMLAACASGENAEQPTADNTTVPSAEPTAEETEAPETTYLDTIEKKTFGGADFRMIGIDDDSTINFSDGETTGEAINDAIYKRDLLLQEACDVVISATSYALGQDDAMASDIQNLILAGDTQYSMVVGPIHNVLVNSTASGLLYDIASLPTIDMTNPWWSTYANTNLKIAGKLFFTTGDICPMYYNTPYVMCYNMRLADDYGVDMHELVMNGQWTLDKLAEFTETFTVDLNGDGTITPDDQIAYTHVRTGIVSNSHYIACGQTLNTIDADGKIVVDLSSEASVSAVDKLQIIFTDLADNYFSMEEATPMFTSGKAFLFGNSMATAVNNFRDMEDNFGFLPLPKYNEEQENYYTSVNTWTRGYVGVPKTIADPDMTGYVMELMAYFGNQEVRPMAYDAMLYSKMARTEESVDMLDLIYKGIYIDINYVLDFGGSNSTIMEAVMNGSPFASTYASKAKVITKMIDSYEKKFQ